MVLYSDRRVSDISTQVEETFINMKVAWTKNKREFKRLHLLLFSFRRVELRSTHTRLVSS